MTNDCLLTKLGRSISNQNALILGHIQVTIKKGDNQTIDQARMFMQDKTGKVVFHLLKGNQDLTSMDGSVVYGKTATIKSIDVTGHIIAYSGGSDGDIIDIDNKYKWSRVKIENAWLSGPLSQLFFEGYDSPIESLILVGRLEVASDEYVFEDIKDCPNLNELTIRAMNLTGNFEYIVNFTSLTNVRLNNVNLVGNIDCLINNNALVLPNLKSLDLKNTPEIVKTEATITALQNLGVTVTV